MIAAVRDGLRALGVGAARLRLRRSLLGAITVFGACDADPAGVRLEPPALDLVTTLQNRHNVLAVGLLARIRTADSAAVRVRLEGHPFHSPPPPAVPVVGDSVRIPVLGLRPESTYELEVVAWGPGGEVVGPILTHVTDALPDDLPRYSAGGPDPSAGYVVFSSGSFGLVIDNDGRVVWYRRFPERAGLAFMAQPNGRYVTRAGTSGTGSLPWIEVDPWGDVTRTLTCASGLQPRMHELMVGEEGDYWVLCDEVRTMDLAHAGVTGTAPVLGTSVEYVAANGSLLFRWSPFEHLALTGLDPAETVGPALNWTHGNSMDRDEDGNLLVSFRNLGALVKIDVTSGAVLWQLGGWSNDFELVGTSFPPFARQHSVRVVEGGVLLLDNVGDPHQTRAERYAIDESAGTATLVAAYGAGPGIVTEIGGGVQALPGGRTLVSYGTAGRVAEYDASGRVVWQIEGDAGYVFRAQRISSLYTPGVGTAR